MQQANLAAALQAADSTTTITVDNKHLVIAGAVIIIALAALVMAFFLRRQVLAAGQGTEKMQEIAAAVQQGATAYLTRQFRTLAPLVVIVVILISLLPGDASVRIGRSVAFLLGAGFSATIGYLGMWLAVRANVRVAAAANEDGGRTRGAMLAFRTGGVVGLCTVGLGLLGAATAVLSFRSNAPYVLEGFGFGAALLAMFMRVGGGIFTKAADVGADLVGKVEQGIPEDDPRNAATIADNVGDNVGDCAGMAADLFESYAVTLVAALILGKAAFGADGLTFPLIVPAIGAITAALGVWITRVRGNESGLRAIYRGFYLSALISAVLVAAAAFIFLPASFADFNNERLEGLASDPRWPVIGAVVIGIVLAGAILWLTGYFTGTDKRPVQHVAKTSRTGPATVVLAGVGVGFESAVYTAGVIAAALCGIFLLSGGNMILALFLVALAGCGLLTTVGVIVAMDTFGPVSDNAQGIAEMSGDVSAEGAKVLTDLDAVGNTTKAITKGIAIATAVLAATALFGSYNDAVQTAMEKLEKTADLGPHLFLDAMQNYQIIQPITLVGVILGAATVFLFSGLAIDAVTRAAGAIVLVVRRQFKENPGIMTGEVKPNYSEVVDICTRDSLRELLAPGMLAAFAPIAVGLGLGVGPLAGFLAGAICTGLVMAIFLANSGGAWDNAKKLVEDGMFGGKGTDAHSATVIGDTVGDPFKDTAGPAINPLIKVMNLVSVLVAPVVVTMSLNANANHALRTAAALLAGVLAVAPVVWARIQSVRMAHAQREELHQEPVS
ncbi:MAG: sodium-translocating pyrophosphatase [Micrococcales bacterium]|nr:sodium-translocating pyrophosphatase [Micrococcales bacterium]